MAANVTKRVHQTLCTSEIVLFRKIRLKLNKGSTEDGHMWNCPSDTVGKFNWEMMGQVVYFLITGGKKMEKKLIG